MSEGKFTAGPWFVEENSYTVAVARENRINTPVAYCPLDYPNREANARLIAAAPELLEACKKALGGISGTDAEHIWINSPQEPAIGLGEFIRAAIQKAEGQP